MYIYIYISYVHPSALHRKADWPWVYFAQWLLETCEYLANNLYVPKTLAFRGLGICIWILCEVDERCWSRAMRKESQM